MRPCHILATPPRGTSVLAAAGGVPRWQRNLESLRKRASVHPSCRRPCIVTTRTREPWPSWRRSRCCRRSVVAVSLALRPGTAPGGPHGGWRTTCSASWPTPARRSQSLLLPPRCVIAPPCLCVAASGGFPRACLRHGCPGNTHAPWHYTPRHTVRRQPRCEDHSAPWQPPELKPPLFLAAPCCLPRSRRRHPRRRLNATPGTLLHGRCWRSREPGRRWSARCAEERV